MRSKFGIDSLSREKGTTEYVPLSPLLAAQNYTRKDMIEALSKPMDDVMATFNSRVVTMDDVKDATAMSIANDAPEMMIATVAGSAIAGSFFGPPGVAVVSKSLPLITSGIKFLSNLYKSNEDFWKDYRRDMAELGSNDFVRGFGDAITFSSLPRKLINNSSPEMVGEMVGSLARDFALAAGMVPSSLSSANKMFAKDAALAGSMALGGAISAYNREKAMGESEATALKVSMASAVSSGASGLLFFGVGPHFLNTIGKKLFNPSVRTILNVSVDAGWAVADTYMYNAALEQFGQKDKKIEMSGTDALGMFGAGMFLSGAVRTPAYVLGVAARGIGKKITGVKIKKQVNKVTANDIKKQAEQYAGIINSIGSIEGTITAKQAGKIADNIVQKIKLDRSGKTKSEYIKEYLIEQVPSEYWTENNISKILEALDGV